MNIVELHDTNPVNEPELWRENYRQHQHQPAIEFLDDLSAHDLNNNRASSKVGIQHYYSYLQILI